MPTAPTQDQVSKSAVQSFINTLGLWTSVQIYLGMICQVDTLKYMYAPHLRDRARRIMSSSSAIVLIVVTLLYGMRRIYMSVYGPSH